MLNVDLLRPSHEVAGVAGVAGVMSSDNSDMYIVAPTNPRHGSTSVYKLCGYS